jgi:PLP dependent protein
MVPSFAYRLAEVLASMADAAAAAGRKPQDVELVAVAKTATGPDLTAAWLAGQRRFGHNRVQALSEHFAVLPEGRWHLIGPLQRNKARKAVLMASMIETVADLRLAAVLDRLVAELHSQPMPILVQVNLTPVDGRPGANTEALDGLLTGLAEFEHLRPRGLMSMAPLQAKMADLHRHFAAIRVLAEQYAEVGLLPQDRELSMGMSQDYRIAIEEGATLVRIGRALFPPAEINP